MDLRRLRYFITVADQLHFGRAAALLGVSTPTLSQQIAALERDLGARLLDRDSRRVALTAAGQVLLDEGRGLLATVDRVRGAVGSAGQVRASLNVRITSGIDHVLERQLSALSEDADVRVDLAVSASPDAEVAVAQGRADAALIWGDDVGDPRLVSRTVTTQPVCLAVPAGHRLAASATVSVADLVHERMALFPREMGPAMWDWFTDQLLPNGLQRPDQLVIAPAGLQALNGMLRAVADGRAVAPFLAAVVQRLAPANVLLRPVEPPLAIPISLVWRSQARPEVQTAASALAARLGAADGATG